MTSVRRGRLLRGRDAPSAGERTQDVTRLGDVFVEQILSGVLSGPLDYEQAYDEWVLVLEGGAVLEVDGERFDVVAGDWVLLPANIPHRLIETTSGTSWLAIHAGQRASTKGH